MPIRLTRQILKLIAPLEHAGLLEASMLHTLRALRENNDLLMCILDVFIKEPSIDWIVKALLIISLIKMIQLLNYLREVLLGSLNVV
jgi:phosphatidylinositol kinase/protein kinase (PI-3  family)